MNAIVIGVLRAPGYMGFTRERVWTKLFFDIAGNIAAECTQFDTPLPDGKVVPIRRALP